MHLLALEEFSLTEGPICTGLMSAWLSLADDGDNGTIWFGYEHKAIAPLPSLIDSQKDKSLFLLKSL